jgi:hypothetical protein
MPLPGRRHRHNAALSFDQDIARIGGGVHGWVVLAQLLAGPVVFAIWSFWGNFPEKIQV